MPSRALAIVGLAAAVLAISLCAAGCGGAGSPRVASIASPSTTTTTPASTIHTGSIGEPNTGSGGRSQSEQVQTSIGMRVGNTTQGARFSACMRGHGVTNFPDPNAQGVIQYSSTTGIDPNSQTFTSARTACNKLLPNGGQPTPAQQAQRQEEMLAYSKCMRAHAIKDFPDPGFLHGHFGITITARPGSDLDPNNPQFQAAQRACQGDLLFKNVSSAAGAGKLR